MSPRLGRGLPPTTVDHPRPPYQQAAIRVPPRLGSGSPLTTLVRSPSLTLRGPDVHHHCGPPLSPTREDSGSTGAGGGGMPHIIICLRSPRPPKNTYTNVHTHTHTHARTNAHTRARAHAHTHTSALYCWSVLSHCLTSYLHTHTHTESHLLFTHTHTHTCAPSRGGPGGP